MLKLTEEDKIKLKYNPYIGVKHVKLSVGSFIVKYYNESEILREILGKKIADIIGIKCPKYYLYEQEHCILSEDLNSKERFIYTKDLGSNITTIQRLKECLNYQKYAYNRLINVEELMFEIKIMHFIDILFSNINRNINKYGFILNDDGTATLSILDNENFLNHFDKPTRPFSFEKENDLHFLMYSKKSEAQNFIESASSNDIKMFEYIYTTFNPKRVHSIISLIEKETNITFVKKNLTLLKYTKNYLMIGKILSTRKKIVEEKLLKIS